MNKAKKGLSLREFMEKDSDFWTKLGIDKPTRMARLKKIEDFQKICGYDPDKIRREIAPLLDAHYDHSRKEEEKCIADLLDVLDRAGIPPLTKTAYISAAGAGATAAKTKARKSGAIPELIFVPADENIFKTELLKSKKAHFVLTYASGKIVTSPWNISSFDASSNLRSNIQSRPFWRNKAKEGLVKVEVFID